MKYKPTTDQLLEAMKQAVGLRIGLITNLPANVTAAEGKKMVDDAGITPFLDPKGFVTNHDAGAEKPNPKIYAAAAAQMGVPIERCVFVGENLIEVIGAQGAGMQALLKPIKPGPISETNSGRLSEIILEEDHLVGKRIVGCGIKIRERLEAIAAGTATNGSAKPPVRAMGLLVWLTKNCIDPYHHRKEEEVLVPFAIMRGLPPADCAFVEIEHQQGRNYCGGMDIALRRYRSGDHKALGDFRHCVSGFIELYKEHGRKEDDILFKKIGQTQNDAEDALIVDLMQRIGPTDLTLYMAVIADMELELLAVSSGRPNSECGRSTPTRSLSRRSRRCSGTCSPSATSCLSASGRRPWRT